MFILKSCKRIAAFSAMLLLPSLAFSQTYFAFRANTEDSYAIVIASATINGLNVECGDEIGAFTPAGLCVGATIVAQQTANILLTAWQDDSFTAQRDGYVDGEAITLRVWDISSQTELVMNASFTLGNGTFGLGPFAQAALSLTYNFPPQTRFADKYSFEEDTILTLTLNDLVYDDNDSAFALNWTVSSGVNITSSILPGNVTHVARFEPKPNWFGSENFTFIVTDPGGKNDTAVVTIEVLSFNDLPVLQLPASLAIAEDDTTRTLALDGFVSDIESADAQITWQATPDANFAVRYNAATRTLRLVPRRDYFGAATLQLRATDQNNGAAIGSIPLTITPVQDQPQAATLLSPIGGAFVDTVNVNLSWRASIDADNDPLTYTVVYGTDRKLLSQFDSSRIVSTSFRIPNNFLKLKRWYYWRVYTSDGFTPRVVTAIDSFRTQGATGVNARQEVPTAFALEQNYPNPFSLSGAPHATQIRFSLPQPALVTLTIHNALGQKIVSLLEGSARAGSHVIHWNGHDAASQPVRSGLYWLRLTTREFTATRKIVVVR
ncbi:MAG: T9SS type A sorting domain-containing protein [candidate division KSB1 bacterium]